MRRLGSIVSFVLIGSAGLSDTFNRVASIAAAPEAVSIVDLLLINSISTYAMALTPRKTIDLHRSVEYSYRQLMFSCSHDACFECDHEMASMGGC